VTHQRDSRTEGQLDAPGDQTRQPAYLPNFCASSIVFGVVLIAELMAIALTLARQNEWGLFFSDLAKTSLLLVWTGLTVTATLCLLRRWLNRFSVVKATSLTLAAVAVVIVAVSEIVFWLGAIYSPPHLAVSRIWFPQNHWYFVSSNIVMGTIMAGLVLRYFYVSHQWQRNVESEARTRIHALQARIRPHFRKRPKRPLKICPICSAPHWPIRRN